MTQYNVPAHDIRLLVFDFDGVLTDNKVYVHQNGLESVCCSRADGLAFDAFKKIELSALILSSEKNPVVSSRAEKIKIPVFQAVSNKAQTIRNIAEERNISLQQIAYIGNDLNDYYAMTICGLKICPQDSHPKIKDLADIILSAKGGQGVAREIAEQVLEIDLLNILYKERKL